jgi:hypothetical protein
MKTILFILLNILSIYEISAQKEIIGIWKIGTSSSTVDISQQKENFKGRIFEVTKDNRKKEVQQLTLSNINYVPVSDKYTCKLKITNGFVSNCEFKFLDKTKSELQMTAKFMFFSKTVKFRRLD